MKKKLTKKLLTLVCAVLAIVMSFSFVACGKKNPDTSGMKMTSSLELTVGSTGSILVTEVTGDVTWTSSNEAVATVSTGKSTWLGKVTAVSVGTAIITATAGSESKTCTVTVSEKEVITITKDGSAVGESITLDGKDSTVQLSASSSKSHTIQWSSDNDLIATVSETGLVTAKADSGTAHITAKCSQDNDVVASVTIVIGSGVDAAYNIEQGDESGAWGNPANSNENPGKWYYWNQFGNVSSAVYNNGTISLVTQGVEEGAYWYNVQLFYTATQSEGLVSGSHYKVTFDINTSMEGGITVNGYPLYLAQGDNHCTIYYDHSVTAFALQLGIENEGCTITNAEIQLKNIKWETATKVNLNAPSFSISNNVISITDTNPAGSVGNYLLNLYNGSSLVGSVIVKNGQTIDTSTISPNGTYTGKLVAQNANAHYVSSSEATSASGSVVVNNAQVHYTMQGTGAGGATSVVGTWTYWHESWVTFNGSVTDGVADISYSNNSGNWYDTQLFYKTPGKASGSTYSIKLKIKNVPNYGRISINSGSGNQVYNLTEGDNELTISVVEGSGASLTIVFGVDGENNAQDIQRATNMTIELELA